MIVFITRFIFTIALCAGAAVAYWMGAFFYQANPWAFTITGIIGGIYAIGAMELLRFRYATYTLARALAQTKESVASLEDWLGRLDVSLQNFARLRIEGERVGPPSPVLTPYFAGLLVMLGLLGTFVGMIDTLKGAVIALEGSTELEAIRAGLTAPIKGLGLAFGTSVAGVATSAMLGLMATLCRQERLLATRRLDQKIRTVFQAFSLTRDRRETFKALQMQTQALPGVVDTLKGMAEHLSGLGERLTSNQEQFHASVKDQYIRLADSVSKVLSSSLEQGVQNACANTVPIVEAAMAELKEENRHMNQELNGAATQTLEGIAHFHRDAVTDVTQAWQKGLAAHNAASVTLIQRMEETLTEFQDIFTKMSGDFLDAQAESSVRLRDHHESADKARLDLWQAGMDRSQADIARLVKTAEELIDARITTEAQWMNGYAAKMSTLTQTLNQALESLRAEEEDRGKAALERLENLASVFKDHLVSLEETLAVPMTQLLQTAAEVPKAASEAIGHVKAEAIRQTERENTLLDALNTTLARIDALSASMHQSASQQSTAITSLVVDSKETLAKLVEDLDTQLDASLIKVTDVAANLTVSSVELASLGDAFSIAVDLFQQSNQGLVEKLDQIESALSQNRSRSDAQMEYYVAQAREIIDFSLQAQKEIIEALQSLPRNMGKGSA